MAPPNTRPPSRPLRTNWIRASFEGKRSKSEVQSPTHTNGNGAMTHDPESLRKAIDEAINSEAFQTAIAANLANLIKPSIKSALDTIQPVVEAVYNHEVLLRKTNRSVENILERMETNVEAHAHQRDSVVEPHGSELGEAPTANAVDETDPAEEEHIATAADIPAPAIQERAVDQSTPSTNFEEFKQLLDESNARTATSLSELTSSVEAGNGRIAEVVQEISHLQSAVRPTKEGVDALKAFSEQSATTAAVMQAQLDQLKLDIGIVIDSIGGDLGKNVKAVHEKVAAQDTSLLSSHTSKLDAIATDLEALKAHSDTIGKLEAISADFVDLKGSVEAGSVSNSKGFTGLDSQITKVLATIEGHTSTLAEIKDRGAHPEILAALQQSNDSHAAHAAALGEINERALNVVSASASIPEGGSPETIAALQDLKVDLAALKENIAAGLTSNNENVTGLSAKINNVLTTVEAHKAADAGPEILAAVQQSNKSHASHAASLEEIKSLNAGPAPATDSSDLATLEAQVGSVVTVLAAHTSALDEIKTATSFHAKVLDEFKSLDSASAQADSSALENRIGALAVTLDTHTSALDQIKSTAGSHSSALDELKTASTSHATALEGVKSLGSASGPSENTLSALESQISDLSATLDAHTLALDEIKSMSGLQSAALDEIKATGASHATALENARSLGADPAPAPDSNSLISVETQIATIIATLALHTSTLDELKSTSGTHNATVINALGTHTSALDEIKGTTTSHAAALEQARSPTDTSPPAAESANIANLEAQVAAIIATLEAHTAVLGHIKSSGASTSTAVAPAANAEALEGQFSTIIETLDAHTNLLNELKDDVSAEILTTLHELGQSQTQHGDLLTEIREADVSDEILTLLHASGESHTTTGATLSQIHANVVALNESHAEHTTALDEIKSRSAQSAPAVGGSDSGALEAKIDGISSTLASYNAALCSIQESHASHTEALNEIRDATAICNESHADHALALSEIKEISDGSNEAHSSHIAALADIKEATAASNEAHASHTAKLTELIAANPSNTPAASGSESPDLAALESHINTIIITLENQTAILSSIKDSNSDPSILEAVKVSHEILTSHTSLLDAIKDNSSHEDILSNISALKSLIEESKSGINEHSTLVRDLHSDTKENHTSLTSAIAELALGGAAGAGAGAVVSHESEEHSTEILTAVKSVKEKVDFVASQIEINHTTVTTSITTLSDELKAEIDATGTQITESITILDGDIKALNLTPLISAVDRCGQVVKDLSAQIDNLEGQIEAHNSKLNDLREGVHLNDTGISQLRDYVETREVAAEPVPEALWFGSGSGSPSARRSTNPFDRVREDEPVDEDEAPVLDAIPEVDAPLDDSPARERFGQVSLEPTIDEHHSTSFEHEIPSEEVETVSAWTTTEITPELDKVDEVLQPALEVSEPAIEIEPETADESRDVYSEPALEHFEGIRMVDPEPHKTELVEAKEDAPVEDAPLAHEEEKAAEEMAPVEDAPLAQEEEKPAEETRPIEDGPLAHEEAGIAVEEIAPVEDASLAHGEEKKAAEEMRPVENAPLAHGEEEKAVEEIAPVEDASLAHVEEEKAAEEMASNENAPLAQEEVKAAEEMRPVEDAPLAHGEEEKSSEEMAPVKDAPLAHGEEEKPAEEITPIPRTDEQDCVQEDEPSHESVPTEPEVYDEPVPHTDGHYHVPEDEPGHESVPTEPEVYHEPVPKSESIEEPTEASIEPETTHEMSQAEPTFQHHGQGQESEKIEEPIPEPETAYAMSEAEPILQHHDPDPESEKADESTETIPEPDPSHEKAAPAALEERDTAPEPTHVLDEENLDEAATSPASVSHETVPLAPSHEPEQQAGEPSPST